MGQKITELDLVESLDGTELFEVVKDGLNKAATPDQIATLFAALSTNAGGVNIADPGSHFTGTTVEEALQELGQRPIGGDATLRGELASILDGKGAAQVSWAQSGGTAQSVLDELRRIIRPEHHGADVTGAALSDAAFAACAALGKVVTLTPGATYYLSARVSGVTGTRFICAGECTIKLKTGTGGFAHKNFNTLKDENSVFFFYNVDNVGVSGVRFITDGTAEACIYPVRVRDGLDSKGGTFERLTFSGLSALGGGYLSINSAGAGSYRVRDIEASNCGTAQNGSYWTGTPQITVFEIDNDMVGSVPSEPGYFENIRGINVLLTGAAKTAWGQQTDVVNIAGVSGTDRKGPVGHGVYGDGIGEVVDMFCSHAIITGVRGRNVHGFVAKLVHGAQHNVVEVDSVESCGLAAVCFAGSNALAVHTANNVVKFRTAKGIGDAGDGPTSSDVAAVLIMENSGSLSTCLPRNNVVEIDTLVCGSNMDYVVKDNCTVDNANGNIVRLGYKSGTWGTAFVLADKAANTRVRYLRAQPMRAAMSANQTLSNGSATTVAFNTAASDGDALLNTSTHTARIRYPGWYTVQASVRVSGQNATDYLTLRIQRNGSTIAFSNEVSGSGSTEPTYTVSIPVYVSETEVGTTAADFNIQAVHTGTASATALNTQTASRFEIYPLPG